jgi:diguanylate cyclase (GGDEF)-like protein
MRAYNDNTTYVKIEYQNKKTFMITAVPCDLADRKVVIEILKDITNSVFLNNNDVSNNTKLTDIHTLIDNMNKLAFSDALTGLYNRRYIVEKLPVDLINTALLAKGISIVMVDIDYFKDINDKYGHLGGDHTLKSVAAILSSCIIRSSDWIARFGGDEFMICVPGAKLEVAKALAENMRRALESTAIRYNENEFYITASFGIYSTKSTGSKSVDELLGYADEKLYLAKKKGRNRIEY